MRATNRARELLIEHVECQVEHANAVMTLMGHHKYALSVLLLGYMVSTFTHFSRADLTIVMACYMGSLPAQLQNYSDSKMRQLE